MKKSVIQKIIIVILCILLNLTGKITAEHFNLPVWLDMAGTCLAAYYTGPIGAVIAGVSCNLLFAIVNPVAMLYALASLVAALAVSFGMKKGWFESLPKAALASFWVGNLCLLVSTPLNLVFQNGYSGNLWGDALFDMLDWYGAPKAFCALAGEAVVEVVDKQIGVLAAYGLVRLFERKGWKRTPKLPLLLVAGMLLGLVAPVHTAYAQTRTASAQARTASAQARTDSAQAQADSGYYVMALYNNRSGMMSSEANVIGETEDGYIWIGSYAGLTRYDGSRFEFIRESGIVSVTSMYTDRRGRLWIGTNNGGVARYENGKFLFFTVEDGLPANSVRAFAEAKDGTIYVATTDKVCAIDGDDRTRQLSQDMTYIVSMAVCDGRLVCVSNGGKLFVMDEDGSFLDIDPKLEGLYYRCAVVTSRGLIVGTAEDELHILDVYDRIVRSREKIQIPLKDIVAICEDESSNLWICGEKGFGYLAADGDFVEKHCEGFDSSFAWLHEDYQGNIWVVSTRCGVLKLSASRFANLFDEAGIGDAVVNAFVSYQGDYYCGTDTGLIVLDGRNYREKSNSLTELLASDRIRCLMEDSGGTLWICTYGDNGLVSFDGKDEPVIYNMDTQNTTTNRFRCTAELQDGTIAAGTADGINFIKDGKVTGRLTAADGLANSQILCLVEGTDGRLYAGSDGAGIYVIENQKIVKNYTTEDGLPSGIILRMVPCDGGFIVVTGNALAYMGEEIRQVKDFPYFNNYDVMLDGDTAFVLSSAGLYEVNTDALCGDAPLKYRLYAVAEGLTSALTANAWNYKDEEGRLFFCTNSGVSEFYGRQTMEDMDYRYGILAVVCDGEVVPQSGDLLRIPAKAKTIMITGSVRNYALTGAKVKFYVEGMEHKPEIYDFNQIEPIQLSGFSHGEYEIRMQILDSMGETVLSEKAFRLKKDAQVWENVWYQIYLAVVCLESLIFITWTAISLLNSSRRKTELEKVRVKLEKKVASQVDEMEALFMQAVTALSEAVDAKDRYTSGHAKRVAIYSRMLAVRLGKSEKEQEEIYIAGLLHDIGKIRIPEDVINKPDRLSDQESELFKIHPVTGFHILKGISLNRDIADGARFHHECYDGSGYPNGLKGTDIPEIARIIGVADAYDAMASNRSYRNALPQRIVRAEIEKGRGTQFDPVVADVMLQIIDEDKDYELKQEENQQKKILVVDDDEINIYLTREILKQEDLYTITSATSGEEALEMLDRDSVDLVLLDIEMPGMNGFETFQHIREKSAVPVVFITAEKDIQLVRRAADIGVEEYITKPFIPLVLREIVQGVLSR